MLEKLQGIVTDIRRHNDRHNVVTLYTRTRGRVAFLSSAGNGRQARLRQARLQPLAVIEAEVNYKDNKELQLLGEFNLLLVCDSIRFNPVKSALAMFVAEFLNHLTRTSPPDTAMWDYVAGAIKVLNGSTAAAANFHITLLVSLLPFAGIQPDLGTYAPGRWFDMQGGVFTDHRPLHGRCLAPDDARHIPVLYRISFGNYTRFRFSGQQRRRLLSLLLDYYALHLPGVSGLKSPEVLAEVFS